VNQFGQTMIFRGMASPDPVLTSVDPKMPAWNENYYKEVDGGKDGPENSVA
jgi:hypothetical protein